MLLAQLLDEVADLDDLDGVQAHGGLIQDDDPGVAQQSLGNAHTLLVALGQGGDAAAPHTLDLHLIDDLVDLVLQLLAPQALGLAHEAQVLFRRLVHVEGRLLGEIANQPLGLIGVLEDVVPAHLHMARGGGETAGHNVHGCALARAVGAEKTIDMPFIYLK